MNLKLNKSFKQFKEAGFPWTREEPIISGETINDLKAIFPFVKIKTVDDFDVLVQMKWNQLCKMKLQGIAHGFKSLKQVRKWMVQDGHAPELGQSLIKIGKRILLVEHSPQKSPCIGCKKSWHADRNCNCAEFCEQLKIWKGEEVK